MLSQKFVFPRSKNFTSDVEVRTTLEGITRLPFSTPCGFNTLRLAHVLDSLVRVSRRVVRNRYVYNQAIGQQPYTPPTPRRTTQQAEPPLPNKRMQSDCSLYLLQGTLDSHNYNLESEAVSERSYPVQTTAT